MASGSWTWVGSNSWVGGKVEWSSTPNQSANTSSVTVTLYGCRLDGGESYNVNRSDFQITIDGTRTTRTSGITISGTSYTKIHSQTKTVTHGSDGKKSITISAGGEISETTFDLGTQSRTITLDNITRQFTVSYNANGGIGAPANQTKIYGTNLTLSSSKPHRPGYSFVGWGTSSTDTTADYQPGGVYSKEANITLYAIWKILTYTVSYNANGGTGAPASQTKTYGQTLTLSSTKPTLEGYSFVGWATSANAATASYQPGGKYTTNANVTLYAVWSISDYFTFNVTPPTITITSSDNSGYVSSISDITIPFTVNTTSANASMNFYYSISAAGDADDPTIYGPFAANQSSSDTKAKNIPVSGDMIKKSLLLNRNEEEIPLTLLIYTNDTSTTPVEMDISCPLNNFRVLTSSVVFCARTSDGGAQIKATVGFAPSYNVSLSAATLPTVTIDGTAITPTKSERLTLSDSTVTYLITMNSSLVNSSTHEYSITITDNIFTITNQGTIVALGEEDILIYNTGKCKAVEFVESDETFGFQRGGLVYASEFFETEEGIFINESEKTMNFYGGITEL